MFGSPIIQNGKLVGAVTQVFVNDPTRGYGIFIENVLSEAEKSNRKNAHLYLFTGEHFVCIILYILKGSFQRIF